MAVGRVALCAWLAAVAGCASPGEREAAAPVAADERVRALADGYLAGYFDRNPDQPTYFGVPGRRHDRLPDNSLGALTAWHAREDQWLAEARALDPATIAAAPLRATYAIVREALEGAVAARVCRAELWPVSQMTGWQVQMGYLVTIQPVGSDEARQQALARWSSLPGYIDTEIANLREGLRLGYSSPRHIVEIVVGQLDGLIAGTGADAPFLSPVERDTTAAFRQAFSALVSTQIVPAFVRYRDFLQKEYLRGAREALAVSALPNGAACYEASVRSHSSLSPSAKEIHELGLQQVERLVGEMALVAQRSFQTRDVQSLLKALRTERRYLFRDREELLAYTGAALGRARAAAPKWFGLQPKAEVRIEPYPSYREKNAPNEYNPPAEDGSRPGLFLISAYQAEKKSKSGPESTAFHETIPGHHLQVAIALERREIHPIGRYIFSGGHVEGWALYSERLADEMQLYSSDLDRLGMLSSQTFRAVRLVVDSGLHTMGWSRQQAIEYMLAHTTEEPMQAASEIDRYIIFPGQATSYMLGNLEIQRAREEAQRVLGPRFDIKGFHDRVLEDGGVPLPFLSAKLKGWMEAR